MERAHDLGADPNFGQPIFQECGQECGQERGQERGEPPFHHEWEARVFALNRLLLKQGLYNLDEFRYAIERMPAADYRAASYYEKWFIAIERLLREKGVVT